jgi:hypothetical protein
MASNLDLHIDAASRTLLAAGSARSGTLPTLILNDAYTLRLRVRQPVGDAYEDLDLTGVTIRVGIGNVDTPPTSGFWKLGLSGVTSGQIAHDATAFAVYNAISGLAGTACTVATYGSGGSAWVITTATAGSAASFTSDAFSLFPQSDALVTTRLAPSTGVTPSYLVRLVQEPFVYADGFAAASTANVVTLNLLQNGAVSPPTNEIYRLTIGSDVESGSINLVYGSEVTDPISLAPRTEISSNITSSLIGANSLYENISVQVDDSGTVFDLIFFYNLAAQNITTALSLNTAAVLYPRFYTTTITLGTAGLLEAFNVAGSSSITPQMEVEIVEGGSRRTVFQGQVTIVGDLLAASSYNPTTYSLP